MQDITQQVNAEAKGLMSPYCAPICQATVWRFSAAWTGDRDGHGDPRPRRGGIAASVPLPMVVTVKAGRPAIGTIRGAATWKNRVFAEASARTPTSSPSIAPCRLTRGVAGGRHEAAAQPQLAVLPVFQRRFGKSVGGTPPLHQPAEPAERPNAPAGDSESQTPEQGAAAGGAATPERDVSAGESLPQAPQAP
jgi:hypothetical protein